MSSNEAKAELDAAAPAVDAAAEHAASCCRKPPPATLAARVRFWLAICTRKATAESETIQSLEPLKGGRCRKREYAEA